jgi:NAD(P)H dehydrogenase (quinone)
MIATQHPLQILVVYYSRFGVVELLAERIAEGARREPGVQTDLLAIDDQPVSELRPDELEDSMHQRRAQLLNRLASADAIIIGSPSYFGSMASPLKRFFEDCLTADDPPSTDRSRPWRHHRFRNKVGAAFTASGTPHGGNEQTLHSILIMLMHLGMVVVTPGQRSPILEREAAPYGATAVSGADGRRLPDPQEQDEARDLGEQVAQIAAWIRDGRDAWNQRQTVGSRHAGKALGLDASA